MQEKLERTFTSYMCVAVAVAVCVCIVYTNTFQLQYLIISCNKNSQKTFEKFGNDVRVRL